MLEALLIVALVVGIHLFQTRGLPEGPAPALEGALLDGRPANLADLSRAAGNKPVLVAFWASWCPICKAELGSLADVGRDWPTVTIAMQSGGPAEVARFLAGRDTELAVLNDPEGELASRYRVRGVPTHFIVDAAGNVRFRTVGYTPGWGLRLRLWWAQRFPS